MERYENLFAQLNDRREGAFVPFVTLGDPGIEQSLKIIDTLIDAGADALELGGSLLRSAGRWPYYPECELTRLRRWRHAGSVF
ncbi:tryptophan synthase subunit alpha [Salmonella enterica subsp. enterica]|uniref:tryptophan synthase n=1 Tax=Salmonella enterica I TaxID=59201 RepID=A0A447PB20_SALET|nr:tryptophan synthase subunit alpha [Salmonella enterica subsp. enterica]